MNILMMTNTYTPHVGGVARSVEVFTNQYIARGHQVMVVAPDFPDMPEDERNVIRVPAIQNFNGSDFSVRLPFPLPFIADLDSFRPDIVHSHHPFMLGSTALHVAQHFHVPLVFTHHTMYERYTHYVPGDSPTMQRFVIALATGYANLCNHVIAPSESTAEELMKRGVTTPITVVPTGVDVDLFSKGCGAELRKSLKIAEDAFVVGHIGRLAPEKNLPFLAKSVCAFMKDRPDAQFLLAGTGPSQADVIAEFERAGIPSRLHCVGQLTAQSLVDCYTAMDVFVFASFTETQGMVLTEAMAAGAPVVAVDAPGAREVVIDQRNGRLLPSEDESEFAKAIAWVADLDRASYRALAQGARDRASEFSMDACALRALQVYEAVREESLVPANTDGSLWETSLEYIATEWHIFANAAEAAGEALGLRPSNTDHENA